ncbi:MAG: alpha-L-fucosidase [Planctomycetes bacterium SM23_25]|nr:MAG: alpha-L-fucosidase [Planctomycetes bacterium SM23_25]
MAAKQAASRPWPQARRLKWWQEARFGMFIHWGLYSQLGRHEWVMNRERIPVTEYEKLADTWKPKPRPAREWARLARAAGMKYMVMTTKHHEGFCLWDTEQTDYNAVRRGPGRDLVREYVDACREAGLKVGFYYSLMDWHHPDGARCASDERARRRFLDFTQGCVRELMTNYGKIDILWYDVSWPLRSPTLWESRKMTRMARRLQPHILVNNRAQLPEDFGTPEEHIQEAEEGRAWEACMTFNGSWGYMPSAIDWHSTREVLAMLCQCAGGFGNLLLNIGPAPDGSVPPEAPERLIPVGKWLAQNGEAVYGRTERVRGRMEWHPCGRGTIKGKNLYWWVSRWPGKELTLAGLKTHVVRASLLATGQRIAFRQTGGRVILTGLPRTSPDRVAGVTVIKLECASKPRQELGAGCVVLKKQ